MFNWLNKQGVFSELGFVFQRVNRFCYHYSEGEKTLQIKVEPGIMFEELFFDPDAKWQIQSEEIPVTESELRQIKINVDAALAFMGIQHKFK